MQLEKSVDKQGTEPFALQRGGSCELDPILGRSSINGLSMLPAIGGYFTIHSREFSESVAATRNRRRIQIAVEHLSTDLLI